LQNKPAKKTAAASSLFLDLTFASEQIFYDLQMSLKEDDMYN
jgi:hypothetical protein